MVSMSPIVRPLVVLAACAACSPAPTLATSLPRRPSILIVSIDTLRADHLGCYGYEPYAEPVSPSIDALASESLRFTRFYAARGQTAPSLCSLMLGKYPSSHGVRDNGMRFAPGQRTLFERLGELGYETAAFVSRIPAYSDGHPARGVDVLEAGETRPDGAEAGSHHESDEIVLAKALAWLDGRERSGAGPHSPFFAWVHFYGVHKPYEPGAPFERAFTGDYRGELRPGTELQWERVEEAIHAATLARTPLSEADHRFVVGLYDGGIRAVDERVGTLLERLADRGLADETLVILTADHGEELGEHRVYYYHGNSVYRSTLRVPLLVRWPGVLPRGGTFDALSQNVDIVPTILDWLDVDIPPELEGVSLAPWLTGESPAGPPRHFAYVEWQDLIWGTFTDSHHYLSNPLGVWLRKSPYDEKEGAGFAVGCAELYAIDRDPYEQSNVVDSERETAAELRAATFAHRTRPAVLRTWEGAESESLDELKALGYVGSLRERDDVLFGAQDCGRER